MSPAKKFNRYKFHIQSLNGNTCREVEVLGQQKICEYIPKLTRSTWLREMSVKKIWINDMTSESSEGKSLLGAIIMVVS